MDGGASPTEQPHHLPFQFSPILIGLVGIIAGAIMVATYQCIAISCNNRSNMALNPNAFRREQELLTSRRRAHRPNMPNIGRVVHLIPVFRVGKGCAEGTCAVCLGEFAEGEELRMLPRCSHLFHADCVDMWLFSHANCPLCRAEVSLPPPHSTPEIHLTVSAGVERLPV